MGANGKRKLWKVFAVMSPQKDTLETALRVVTEIGYNGAVLKTDVSERACGFESYTTRQRRVDAEIRAGPSTLILI